MTHADIVRVFTYTPIGADQEQDLIELHTAAQQLATTIYKVVNPSQAQGPIQQLAALVSGCRLAIELSPRQGERKIQLMS